MRTRYADPVMMLKALTIIIGAGIIAAFPGTTCEPGKMQPSLIFRHSRSGMRTAPDHPVIIADKLWGRESDTAIKRDTVQHIPDAIFNDAAVQHMDTRLTINKQIGAAALATTLADHLPGLETPLSRCCGKI